MLLSIIFLINSFVISSGEEITGFSALYSRQYWYPVNALKPARITSPAVIPVDFFLPESFNAAPQYLQKTEPSDISFPHLRQYIWIIPVNKNFLSYYNCFLFVICAFNNNSKLQLKHINAFTDEISSSRK